MGTSLKKALAAYYKAKGVRQKQIKQEQQEKLKRQREAIQTNRQIQRQVGNSKVGRALTGFVYGFNTGLAPMSYSKKAADLGYKAYTPSAAAKERGDTTKKTAQYNKRLESSKAYRYSNTAGNVAATALSFLLGGAGTKAIANKALSTSAAKSAQKAVAGRLAQSALKEGGRRTLMRRVLERSVQNSGRAVTKNAIKSAANKLTGRIARNVAEDVSGDLTIGLYRDLAQARSQGVDVKDIKQLAPYLVKQGAMNTAIGAVTNGVAPTVGAIRRNRNAWKTVERVVEGADGSRRVRYEKVLKNAPKGKSAVDKLAGDIDIVSPRVKRGSRVQDAKAPRDLKDSTLANAMNNDWYVSEIRRKGINGKSVRQVAAEQNKSVRDVIVEDYEKRYGRTLEQSRRLNRTRTPDTTDLSTELSGAEVGTRAVNRGNLRSAYDPTNPNSGKYRVRNENGRLVAHRATGDDYIRRSELGASDRSSIVADRKARLRNRLIDSGEAERSTYNSAYVPTYDIKDLRLARQLKDSQAEKWLKRNTGMDSLEYARKNGVEPSYALNYAKDKIAEKKGARLLSEEERATYMNVNDEIAASASRRIKQTQAEPLEPEIIDTTQTKNVTTSTASNPRPTRQTTSSATEQSNPNVATPAGTPVDVPTQAGQTPRQAMESESFAPNTSNAPDITMGGRRSGAEAGRSESADSVSRMRGNTPRETKEVDDFLEDTKTGKKFSETNKEALDRATDRINRDGLDNSRATLRQMYDNNSRWDNETFAESVILQERYRNIERIELDRGNTAAAKAAADARDELAGITSIEASEAGKALQSMKLFGKMSSRGRVNAVLMMKAKIERQTGIKNIKIDNTLLDMLHDAKTIKDQQRLQEEISKNVWDQVPSTLTEKLAAWRYLSMLGNPKTHIRNVMGNLVFAAPRALKNFLGAGAERVFLKDGERTKAILNPLADADRLRINKGIQDWDSVKETFLRGSGKYDLGLRRAEGSRVFKSKALQGASDVNSYALNKEDEIFAEFAYSHAYAQYLKANKISAEKASEEVLEQARKVAWDEALNATYRAPNAFAEIVNKARKYANVSLRDIKNAAPEKRNSLILKKAGGTTVDAVIPFAKTPANILSAGVNYSPVGLIKGMGQMATATTTQQKIKAIESLSEGLTGTGIFAAGMLAAKLGVANASIDLDDKGYYDYDRGEQEYSIRLGNDFLKKIDMFDALNSNKGNDVSVSADWLAPACMAFFQGVELANSFGDSKTGGELTDKTWNAITGMVKMSDPVLELSMLSSLQNAFDTSDADANGMNAVTQGATNVVQSRLGQYVPTAMSQVVKTADKAQRSTASMKTGAMKTWDKFLNQQENKIPLLSQKNPYKSDAFGNLKEEKTTAKEYVQNFIKNAISPANVKQIRNNKVDKELQRLIESGQPTDGLLPQTAYSGNLKTDYDKKHLTYDANDLEDYNRMRGKEYVRRLTALIRSKEYKGATNDEKADMIKKVYSDVKDEMADKIAMKKGVKLEEVMRERNSTYKEREPEMAKLGINNANYAKVWQNVGKARDILKERNVTSGGGKYTAETLASTETKGGVRNFKQAEVATSANEGTWVKTYNLSRAGYKSSQVAKFALTDKEKDQLAYISRKGKKSGLDKNKLAAYINGMNISRREKWARFETNRYANWINPFGTL